MRGKNSKFTLVELLVVIAIISILAGMLLPALEKAMTSARSSFCLNNQKQIGVALMIYVDDHNGFLPPQWQYDSLGSSWKPPYWPELIAASGLGESQNWHDYHGSGTPTTRMAATVLCKCPEIGSGNTVAAKHHGLGDYGGNSSHVVINVNNTLKLAQFPRPASSLFALDSCSSGNSCSSWYAPCPVYYATPNATAWYDPRHNGGATCLFLDGRATWLLESAILNNKDDIWNHEQPVKAGHF